MLRRKNYKEARSKAGEVDSPLRARYRLDDLLKGMTPRAMREAFDWGDNLEREASAEDLVRNNRAASFRVRK